MILTFRDLTEKEVINCNDGSKIGCVTDIEISADDCRITALIVGGNSGLFEKRECVRIPWDKIQKIGCDVIIVDHKSICEHNCDSQGSKNEKHKIFFR